jgi:hypothetical protein
MDRRTNPRGYEWLKPSNNSFVSAVETNGILEALHFRERAPRVILHTGIESAGQNRDARRNPNPQSNQRGRLETGGSFTFKALADTEYLRLGLFLCVTSTTAHVLAVFADGGASPVIA